MGVPFESLVSLGAKEVFSDARGFRDDSKEKICFRAQRDTTYFHGSAEIGNTLELLQYSKPA